jgi:glycosyltransferase involved in cell wall biosynthesis
MHDLSLEQGLVRAFPQPQQEGSSYPAAAQKLRIVQVLEGASWGELTPDTLNKGLGGRETALLQLGLQWARDGHHVMCFVASRHPFRQRFESGGEFETVDIKLAAHYLISTYQDVVIAWEHPTLFSYKNIAQNVKLKIVGMQVAHFLGIDEEAAKDIDAIVVLSDWAKRFLVETEPYLSRIPIHVVPNGVDLTRYPLLKHNKWRRTSGRFFYSSSPDRGLIHLLRAWFRIKNHIHDAELLVAYGATRYTNEMKWTHYVQGEMALEIERLLRQPGITDIGLVGQKQLADIQMGCSMLAYPCDTMSPTETGCITVTEALAARCPVVTTDCDCLGEEYGSVAQIVPLPYDEDAFLEAMFTILESESHYEAMQNAGREFAEARSWQLTSRAWMDLIQRHLSA